MKNEANSNNEIPYTCYQSPSPITIDGDLTKPVWQNARKSPRFVDMINGQPGYFDTRSAVLWDDKALYAAFWVEVPFIEAKLTKRDDISWFSIKNTLIFSIPISGYGMDIFRF